MTSREIVLRTLEYSGPERVARSFGGSDLCGVGCSVKTHATEWKETGGGRWERRDEWGNTWARLDATSKGEVVKGVLDDLAAADAYRFPDYSRSGDYACVAQKRAECPDRWLIGGMPGFAFNIARKMRKDVLQFDQPDLHGIDTLAAHQERGKITFWCPVDIQRTLQEKDETVIRAKAREMLDKLWRGRGGFIAGHYSDNASIGLDPKWQDYACAEFVTRGMAGRYKGVSVSKGVDDRSLTER